MLTEDQEKMLDRLQMIRRKIELLDSHKLTMSKYITDKQYYESLRAISNEVSQIEQQYGIEPKVEMSDKLRACFIMLSDIERMLSEVQQQQVQQETEDDFCLEDMFEDVFDSLGFTEEEKYNALVHNAIEDIEYDN